MRSVRSIFLAIAALGLGASALAAEKLPVVATFSILGDMVSTIGADRVRDSFVAGKPDFTVGSVCAVI